MDFKDGKREKTIIKTALIGIVTNFFLAAAKIFIAMVSNSVALISDAVNNLSDAGSSIITIFGSKLASKIPGEAPPLRLRQDRVYRRSHRFGYRADARISVSKNLYRKHLRTRAHQLYDAVFGVFVLRGIRQICAWLLLQKDRQTNQIYLAKSCRAGGSGRRDHIVRDPCSAALSYFANIQIDGYAGALASLFIIINGVLLIKETFDKIIGQRVEKEISDEIYAAVNRCEIVRGAYDLILHNYGAQRYVGSVNVEIDEHLPLSEVSQRLNELQIEIYKIYRIYLVFGVYSVNLGQDESRTCVANLLSEFSSVRGFHAFFIDSKKKSVRFDVVVDFAEKNLSRLRAEIEREISLSFPGYKIFIVIDREFA